MQNAMRLCEELAKLYSVLLHQKGIEGGAEVFSHIQQTSLSEIDICV